MIRTCDTYWGSHGCDLEPGHEGACVCGAGDPDLLCSQMRKTDEAGGGEVRFWYDDHSWGEWKPWNWFTNYGAVR